MTIETLVSASRTRLLARAKREGLAEVGYSVIDSPLGPLWVAVGPRGLSVLSYGAQPNATDLGRLIRTYGPGIVPDPRRTSDIEVDLSGLTPFQRRVLRATARVPYGELVTYKIVARQAGNEAASRAAGAAVGANPIPIVVPCHRVVASDGTLGGYAGGLEAKRQLLAIERGEAVPAGGWPPSGR